MHTISQFHGGSSIGVVREGDSRDIHPPMTRIAGGDLGRKPPGTSEDAESSRKNREVSELSQLK